MYNSVWSCVQCVVCVQYDFVCVGVSMWLQCGGKSLHGSVWPCRGVCVVYIYVYMYIYGYLCIYGYMNAYKCIYSCVHECI